MLLASLRLMDMICKFVHSSNQIPCDSFASRIEQSCISSYLAPTLESTRSRKNCKQSTPEQNTRRGGWMYLKANHAAQPFSWVVGSKSPRVGYLNTRIKCFVCPLKDTIGAPATLYKAMYHVYSLQKMDSRILIEEHLEHRKALVASMEFVLADPP